MIYLAAPYSHPNPQHMQLRFDMITEYAFRLVQCGHHVFSPISHSHDMAKYGLPTDAAFWWEQNRRWIDMADQVLVLALPGWKESIGVAQEIAYAQEKGMSVEYVLYQELPLPAVVG